MVLALCITSLAGVGACFPDPPECVGDNPCPDGDIDEVGDGDETTDALLDGTWHDGVGDEEVSEDAETPPEVTADTTPEVSADTTPEVTADTAPEVTDDTAPEVTDDTTPEVTADTLDVGTEIEADVEVVECADLDCALEQRECIEGVAATDARCGDCLADFREDGGACVPIATCASLACALEHRACTERSGDSDATCGGCLGGYRLTGGMCVAIVRCAALTCDAEHRDCAEATETTDAACTTCLPGYAEVSGACLATAPAPNGVTATTSELELVEIAWDPVDNALGYDVYRCDLATCGGGSAGWFALNDVPVADTNYIDDTIAVPPAPAAPSGTSATQDDAERVTVSWGEVSVPAARRYRYRVVAVGPGGDSPASTAVTGNALDRPVTGYELAIDGGAWASLSLGTTVYADQAAPAPSVAAPSASATQGTHEDFVRLMASGGGATAGASRAYAVRATTAFGPGPSSAATGRRPAGALALQWERSSGTSASGFGAIAGATGATYDDFGAPSDGATRWYRVVASTPGAAAAPSDAVAGSRLNPASLVPTGVSASADKASAVEIRWSPVASATGYLVYRCDAASCGATSGWFALTGVPTTGASYTDTTAAVPGVPEAPASVSANGDDGAKVTVSWGAASVAAPRTYQYRVTAVGPSGESAPSEHVQGQVASRPVTDWEIRVDGGAWVPVGGGAAASSYDDVGAPAPTVSAATASASQGTSVDHVALMASGASATAGAERSYAVRARNASGAGADKTATGRRAAGALTYQWERSSGTAASGFSAIAGATGASHNDTGAPSDGSVRWYRVVTSASGATPATSEAVSGHRLGPPTAAPGNVQATTDVESYVRVTWEAVAGATSYVVKRDGVVIAQSVQALVHDDVTAAQPVAWAAPTNIAASTDQSTQVTVTWTAPTRPLGALATYTVAAQNAAGAGPASSGVQGRKARPALEAFEVSYGATTMGAWVPTGSTGATWNHTDAPRGTISGGTASASQGMHRNTRLATTGGTVNAAQSLRYWVRGVLAGGGTTPTSASYATGQIAVGALTRQWQRSSGTTEGSFGDLAGATGATHEDATAPSDGAHRWYRVVLSAAGATSTTTAAAEGWRLAFKAVTGGSQFTCALTNDGRVWCWGANDRGQLGRGSTSAGIEAPGRIESLTDVVEIDGGLDQACARRQNGEVWCWGGNSVGQLGVGDGSNQSSPVKVGLAASAVSVSCGDAALATHCCAALTDGKVQCWGAGGNGQLGHNASPFSSSLPVTVKTGASTTLTSVVTVSAGGLHTCARTASSLFCWGANSNGQLGNGTDDDVSVATLATMNNVAELATGSVHSCARSSSLTVYCWGGPLGNGLDASSASPGSAITSSSIAIEAGLDFSCSLSITGTVQCWGSDFEGKLGNGSPEAHSATPVSVTGVTGATALGSGRDHACIASGGALSCWGANTRGQLGDGTDVKRAAPVAVVLP